MVTICQCDKCGASGAYAVDVTFAKKECLDADLCDSCQRELLEPFRKIRTRQKVDMMRQQSSASLSNL